MRSVIGVLLGIGLAAASLFALRPAAVRNASSLAFLRDRQAGRPVGPDHAVLQDGHPRATLWMAALAMEAGDWEAVLDYALPGVAAGQAAALQYAAAAYQELGDYQGAVDLWQATRNIDALLAMGLSAHQGGQLEAARAAYTAAWELDPRDAATRLVLVLEQMGDASGAERIYRESIERVGPGDRRLPGWYRGLGRLYVGRGQWPESIAAYLNALESARLEPNFEVHIVHYELAGVYLNASQLVAARAQIEAALQIEQDPDYYLRAGQIFEAAGMTQEALSAYRRVLEEAPGNQQALDAVERLEPGE